MVSTPKRQANTDQDDVPSKRHNVGDIVDVASRSGAGFFESGPARITAVNDTDGNFTYDVKYIISNTKETKVVGNVLSENGSYLGDQEIVSPTRASRRARASIGGIARAEQPGSESVLTQEESHEILVTAHHQAVAKEFSIASSSMVMQSVVFTVVVLVIGAVILGASKLGGVAKQGTATGDMLLSDL
jgi:hypothetical protein